VSRAGTKCILVASTVLFCAAAIGSASAQSIQLHKQTKTAPLPASVKPTASKKPAALTATQVFSKASSSVVVVKATDADGKILATGSGVVVAHDLLPGKFEVATNCHVVDTLGSDGRPFIVQGKNFGISHIIARDAVRDLCLLYGGLNQRDAEGDVVKSKSRSVYLPAPPIAKIAPLRSLEVGERVYAIGAPQGLELSLSEGLVSGLRNEDGTTYIQTTAAISNGSSGGGLFDAQGRLVGITTMFLKDSQALNFAVPAELIASVSANDPNSSFNVAQAAADATIAAAAADAAAAAAPRDRWLKLYEDDESTISFDTETVSRDGRNVTVWQRTIYKANQKSGAGKTYTRKVVRATYYCDSRQTSYDQLTGHNPAGEVVVSYQLKGWEIERQEIAPDTVGEDLWKAACE